MDRRRQRRTDDTSRQAEYAAREAAGLLTHFGRRYPAATAIVVLVALVAGLAWYWQQQRRLAHEQEQARQTQALPAPPPSPHRLPPEPESPATQASSSIPAVRVDGPSEGAVNLLLGNPSGATTDPRNSDYYLMVKRHYAASYSNSRGTPNWVSWRVTRADLGDAPRKRQFDPDPLLPQGFYRVAHRDYSGSGFDRGHLCPHGDRDGSQEAAWSTFVMSNVIPQAPNLNQGPWAQLEDHVRDQVRTGRNRAYVVAGPLGTGGSGTAGYSSSIGAGRVNVPAECWKVVVVVAQVPSSTADELAAIGPASRVIAVVMPNDETAIGPDWGVYRTNAAEVERRTGYRFFDRLPPDVAEALRRRVDQTPVAPARTPGPAER
jgi:endonuclease G